jgi:hypothetical protein
MRPSDDWLIGYMIGTLIAVAVRAIFDYMETDNAKYRTIIVRNEGSTDGREVGRERVTREAQSGHNS